MPYRKRNLVDLPTGTALEPLRGLTLAKRSRTTAVLAQGDRVLTPGRRILLRAGLAGSAGWHVGDFPLGPLQQRPNATDYRVVARAPAVRLTPGHFPRMWLIADPSGQTEAAGGTGPVYTGVRGYVKISASFDNGIGTVVVSQEIKVPPSLEDDGVQPQSSGGAWTHLHRRWATLLQPADLQSIEELAAWSDGVTCSLELSYRGSPRVVDCVVFEEPIACARDIATGDAMIPLHANGQGGAAGPVFGKVPLVRRSASDTGGGVEALADAARRLARETGPIVWTATTWEEASQPWADLEAVARDITATSWEEVMSGAASYRETDAGWSPSAASGGARVEDSEATVVLRDADRVCKVRCWVYARTSSFAGEGWFRLQAAPYNAIDVHVTGSAWGWFSADGFLRTGIGATDPQVAEVFGKAGVGSVLSWRYMAIEALD